MKKVLYITNIEVPYRVRFFNELAKHCELTVLYERKQSSNRDSNWTSSESGHYKKVYLNGRNIGTEFSFSFRILKILKGSYDAIIIGCYNSPVQMFAALMMKIKKMPFIINFDGEMFIDEKSIKGKLKCLIIKTASSYLVAGEAAAESLRRIVDDKQITVYYFSSLSDRELEEHAIIARNCKRNDTVLVVGQYYDYKGLDVAIEAARMNPDIHYRFVGTGKRTELFMREQNLEGMKNVEVIPFLTKDKLEEQYTSCAMLVLPSKQECWGLVINEAASFGTPIVSTWGSGAAIEFLAERHPECLAKCDDAEDLYKKISYSLNDNTRNFQIDMLEISKCYSVEKSVEQLVNNILK